MANALQATQSSRSTRARQAEPGAVDAWFAEARRLFDEAEDRLTAGCPLSALSSLVAVPPLHRMIVDRCSELLDDESDAVPDDDPAPPGLYL